MEAICYVCNKRSKSFTKNLTNIKSKHSGTPITELINGFFKDYVSQRYINDAKNCICADCLARIYSYDWMCLKVKEHEREFHMLLLATENEIISSRVKIEKCVEPKEAIVNGRKCNEDENKDVKPVLSSVATPNAGATAETVKRSKPIIIRVVKRVPFLKSKPTEPTLAKPTASVKPTAPAKITAITPTVKAIKREASDDATPSGSKLLLTPKKKMRVEVNVCEFCDERFSNSITFEVSPLSNANNASHSYTDNTNILFPNQ